MLFHDFWGTPLTHSGSHKSYRPLCVLSFRFNYWLHELRPFGYHLINVLLHCCCTALLTHTAGALVPPRRAALPQAVAGLLFAAHPVHTEAVAGIVGRADVGAAIFFLLAFLSYRRYVVLRRRLAPPAPPSGHAASGHAASPAPLTVSSWLHFLNTAPDWHSILGLDQSGAAFRTPTRDA